MWLVLVDHEPTFESTHNKLPPSQSPLASCSLAPCIFARHSRSFNDIQNARVNSEKVQLGKFDM
jgi:hypothetical protein